MTYLETIFLHIGEIIWREYTIKKQVVRPVHGDASVEHKGCG